MNKINENQKITLTLGQLKRLVKEAKTPVGSEYEIVSIKDVGPNTQTPYRRGKHTYDVVWTLDGEEHKIRNLTANNEEEARQKAEKLAYYTTLTFGRKNPSGEPFEVVDEGSSDSSFVYVKFNSIPPREARTKMKMNGFRWDGKRWYAQRTEKTEEVGKSMKRYGGTMEIEDNSDASLMPNNWDLDYMLGY